MNIFPYLFIFLLNFTPSFGCFSSGDPVERRDPESAKLRRAEQQKDDNNEVSENEKQNQFKNLIN